MASNFTIGNIDLGSVTYTLSTGGYLGVAGFAKGDRVRIKIGYDGAGEVGYYQSKSNDEADKVVVEFDGICNIVLAAAIEAFPYTREERIERAIEDYAELTGRDPRNANHDFTAALYAILEAGV